MLQVGTKPGEMANRIVRRDAPTMCAMSAYRLPQITVGDHARARRIAAHFDGGTPLWQRESGRKFVSAVTAIQRLAHAGSRTTSSRSQARTAAPR